MAVRCAARTEMIVAFAATLTMILPLASFGTSEADQDSLVNCNEVMLEDRCACNERVLHALTTIRPGTPDPQESGSAVEVHAKIAIQQVRQQRLRTFFAPNCGHPSSPDQLPLLEPHTTSRIHEEVIVPNLRPVGVMNLSATDDKLLVGRWEGWLTMFGGKATPVSYHVIVVGKPIPLRPPEAEPFVKACSDQGAVFGRIREEGYLELSRIDYSGLAFSIRLWRSSAPRSRDLEGVTLLEVRPGETIVAGLIWLSRPVKFDWTTPPSSYFCQDRDLEEQRRTTREEQERSKQQNGNGVGRAAHTP